MPYQTQKQLAQTLAAHLEGGPWTLDAIERGLRSRLPNEFHGAATDVAQHIFATFKQSYSPDTTRMAKVLTEQPMLGRLHAFCVKHDAWPSPWLQPPKMRPVATFEGLQIPQLATSLELADWLMIPIEQLDHYVDRHG